MLASPAIESPEIAASASGRKRPSSRVSEASATNNPFSVIDVKKSGPSPPRPGLDTFTATAMKTGTEASTSRPAWLRRRRKISLSSDRRNRVDTLRARTVSSSATDIEALPRKPHEDVLQRRRGDLETGHRHALVD